ncbi:tyrosine-type recombinase/integrase [Rhodococcus sp. H29-C3]|uniref:tyrosine-type recombinase/integrase n=1 Tax=Rhodococcus sp. H29-C3 TaxID=3046307 RepID=UPI0024BA367E|nr:tyrosine-type recombinase/integrase [Rhodococcus sp. H29-C3]MDJ0363421.1 tyrosine-type recombinase/integrase [Rhodococcus sp. H29-C3]
MDELKRAVREGRVELQKSGAVRRGAQPDSLPYVVHMGGVEIIAISEYLRSLVLSDVSPLTVRSYAHDLLRWWRVLSVIEMPWERATREEVEVMVGWLRSAANPQRRRSTTSATQPGSVNLKTGKPVLKAGYSPSTINHALTVIYCFYEFHHLFGRGPVINPVPSSPDRRRRLGQRHDSPAQHRQRRAPLRQRQAQKAPRSVPDTSWTELVAVLKHDRDRAIFEFAVSSGARASELLGACGRHIDWGDGRVWVVSKGSTTLSAVPVSPLAFRYLAAYFEQSGTPGADEQLWGTLRGERRPLTYWALRRVMQRANAELGTNWTFHDIRHTAATRMSKDPNLSLVEVQTVMRHRHLTTTEIYMLPRMEDLLDKMQEHFARPRPAKAFTSGYSADDITAVFGE